MTAATNSMSGSRFGATGAVGRGGPLIAGSVAGRAARARNAVPGSSAELAAVGSAAEAGAVAGSGAAVLGAALTAADALSTTRAVCAGFSRFGASALRCHWAKLTRPAAAASVPAIQSPALRLARVLTPAGGRAPKRSSSLAALRMLKPKSLASAAASWRPCARPFCSKLGRCAEGECSERVGN